MGQPHKPRQEMTPEELLAARRRDRWKRYMAHSGRSLQINPEELTEARQKVLDLHGQGMGYKDMTDQGGPSRHVLGDLAAGKKKTLSRESYELIMALKFEPPSEGKRTGAPIPALPSIRRIQALRAIGFSKEFLADYLGVQHQNLPEEGGRAFVHTDMRIRVEEMYEKLKNADPADFGISERAIRMAISRGRSHRLAPPSCWDEDTIDDPDAIPEWTGACGSEEGYLVHVRETVFRGNPIPLCDACRGAVETRPATPPPVVFRHEEFARLTRMREVPAKKLARAVFGDKPSALDSIYRWLNGTRAPRYIAQVHVLAEALDCAPGDLLDLEAMEREASRPPVGHGEFNPYVLRAALALGDLSQGKASRLPGANFSERALSQWLRGHMKPSDPAKLKPIADHFGVPVEVFYV
jgi:hypothetical protein